MKKLYFLLGILCALCFVACSNFQLAGGDMGVVSLSIGDNLAREIRSAASLRSATGGSYTLTASIRGEYSDSQTVAVANGNYSGVTFTFEGVPVGKNIILDLTAKAGSNYIWYGNSGKHTVEQGENLLTIALGRVSGVLMWTVDGTIITPYGDYDTPPIEIEQTSPVWCFDNKGDLYVLESGVVMPYSLKDDGSYTKLVNGWQIGDSPSFLSYDNASGVLYGMRENGVIVYLNSENSSLDVKCELNSEGSSYFGFAVNNNIAYIVEQSDEWGDNGIPLVTVKSYDLKLDGEAIKGSEKTGNEITLLASLGNMPTGHMIYHEGALYLLLSSFSISHDHSSKSQYSCGAILKINSQTLAIDTSFGSGGFLGLAEGREVSGTYYGQDYSQTLYAPTESNVGRTFCGPAGFVAVMPKKLVIGDGGYTLSGNSGGGLLSKRKSRIVTVDLETHAFDIVNIDSSDLYGNIGTICGFITLMYD